MIKGFPVGLLVIAVGMISQMGFLLNADVIEGQYLTLIGIVFGLSAGLLFIVYRRWRLFRKIHVFHNSNKLPWYKKPPNHYMVFALCILGGMVSVTLINNMSDTGDQRVEIYNVTGIGEQRVRYEVFKYLRLSNGLKTITYRPGDNQNFTLGEEVEVTIEKGLLGFSQVLDAKPTRRQW
ncbi:hypothetical protein [Alcanivorax sp.]|uniref:hypothetical protein n=1 Tax=Alcanivorax sp. TaxID=1872427 RepID=UPI000C4AAFF4|nr:hypothetical protein [Alcanivorax sp.]MBQ25272.1 hypothetical protein [Alcanivorax sp.]|tara:strand:- start:1145 stop:1681 length:537 start_codon:yes stop_codon:yes gene_type:complete